MEAREDVDGVRVNGKRRAWSADVITVLVVRYTTPWIIGFAVEA